MNGGVPLRVCPLVQVTGPDPRLIKANASPFHKAADGTTSLSASGFLWPEICSHEGKRHRVVMTSPSIIWPFLKQNYKSRFKGVDGRSLLSGAKVSMIIDQGNGTNSHTELPGDFAGFVQMPAFRKMVNSVIERGRGDLKLGWKLGNPPQQIWTEQQTDIMSHLAVVMVDATILDREGPEVGLGSRQREIRHVHAIGSPFGCISPHHFSQCLVNGTVSRLIDELVNGGRDVEDLRELMVFNGHVLPGMEGGLVLHRDSPDVVGVLSLPLHTSRREYPLVIPIHHIIEGLLGWSFGKLEFPPGLFTKKPPVSEESWGRGNEQSGGVMDPNGGLDLPSARGVVKVFVPGGGWGSGVIAGSAGFIVTCSHVLGKTEAVSDRKIHVKIEGSGWHRAEVIYRFEGCLDLAILKLAHLPSARQTPVLLTETASDVLPGQICFAVGFGQEHGRTGGTGAAINQGNIAKVVYHPDDKKKKKMPVMLINAVSVHPGSSGGALFLADGTLVGLITGNTMHSTGQSLVHFSFGIPAESLRPIFEWANSFCPLENRKKLKELDAVDPQASLIWSLSMPSPPRVPTDDSPGGRAFKAYLAEIEKEKAKKSLLKSRL
ncbi:hypothetical protein BSKO_05283 [Bryopsis sp. KO-2023]|nr:hypothetical protein BSKO_05283 [Bryopsis sp. KO-2023]